MTLAQLQASDGQLRTVLAGTIVFPLRGLWTARGEVDANEDNPVPAGPATLILAGDNDDGRVELAGWISEGDVETFEGRATFLLVAGAGALASQALPAKTYQQAPFPVPVLSLVKDAAEETGEALDDATAEALAGVEVPRWHRAAGRSARQLYDRIAERLGYAWRATDAGAVLFTVDTWEDVDERDVGLFVTGPDDAINRTIEGTIGAAGLRPGVTLRGRRIEEAIYTLEEGGAGLRVMLRYGAGEGAGGLQGDLEAATRAAMPPLVYREPHAAAVRRQNADGTLDLQADDARIGGITAVPYKPGVVGCRLVFAEGERVRLGFEGGDEAAPYATAIDADETAAKGVARKDDQVNCGSLTVSATPDGTGGISTIAIIFQPPGSSALGPYVVTPGGPPVTVPLSGKIVTASQEVFLRGDAVG